MNANSAGFLRSLARERDVPIPRCCRSRALDPGSTYPSVGLKAVWAAVHELPEKSAALCISGGGIRSATFGLGVLQGLARCGLLRQVPLSFHRVGWRIHRQLAERVDLSCGPNKY